MRWTSPRLRLFALVLGGLSAASEQWSWLAVVLLVSLALAVRHRYARLMMALALLAALGQVVTNDVVYPADAVYAVLFFALGAHLDRVIRLVGLACAVVATVVAGCFAAVQLGAGESIESRLFGGAVFAAFAALFTIGGWIAGYVRWLNRRAMQADVDARLEAVERHRLQDAVDQEQERSRIAADMHDVVAHSLAVVAAQADGARYSLRGSPGAAEKALELISETARSTITDLRVILAQLRYQGSTETIPGHEQQRQLFARMRASGMRLVDTETGIRGSSPLIAMTVYRLLGEALTNALKHGDLGAPVEVTQEWSEDYRLVVVNSLSERDQPESAGHGIIGMRERATVAQGTLVSSRKDDRWVLEAHLPVPTQLEEIE